MSLRIGVMGCASIAARMVIPAIQQSNCYELAAVASRQEAKAIEFANRFNTQAVVGYEALISRPDIDVIYMPLPTSLHLEWALKALQAGKHLLIEKSLAGSFHDVRTIVEVAQKNHLLVRENFMFAYHRQMTLIREILTAGRLGEIRVMRSSFGFPPFPDENNIRYQKALEGGALLDAGAYTVKIAQLLLGDRIKLSGGSMIFDRQKQVDVHGSLFLVDQSGVGFQAAYGFDHFYQCSLEIWGAKGRLFANRIFTAGPGVTPGVKIETAAGTEDIPVEPDNHFLNLLDHFYQTVQSKEFMPDYTAVLNQSKLLQEVRDQSTKTFY